MAVTQDQENRVNRLNEVSEDSFRVNVESNKYWGRKNEDSEGIALGKTDSFTSI